MAIVKYPKHKLSGDSSVDKSTDSLLNVSVYTIPLKKELSNFCNKKEYKARHAFHLESKKLKLKP